MVSLRLDDGLYGRIRTHLFREHDDNEQAMFLFARLLTSANGTVLETLDARFLSAKDFAVQSPYYLELADEARASIIKRAHDLAASAIEIHSHPSASVAEFSLSDLAGLRETVPHMWWRLQKRPYLAIVMGPNSFDALVWLDQPQTPIELTALTVGSLELMPTNRSLRRWQ